MSKDIAIYEKAVSVVESCKTSGQLDVAFNYAALAQRKIKSSSLRWDLIKKQFEKSVLMHNPEHAGGRINV